MYIGKMLIIDFFLVKIYSFEDKSMSLLRIKLKVFDVTYHEK